MFLHSICLVWLVFAIIFLWRRISEAFQVKSSEKYRQNLVIYELYISIGLKKSYRSSSIFYPHTVAHLCNQFNHVFAVLISMPRFKSNKFCKTRSKIKLLLQKNCKVLLQKNCRPPMASGIWGLPPYQKTQLSRCKFLALHLASGQY